MEQLLLNYLKDKPGLVLAYHRLKPVLVNVVIFCSICISMLARTESARSFSLGLAAGIVLINVGQGISSLRNAEEHKNQVDGYKN